MGKLSFVVGIGIGYVLGARAGRARYEQMKRQAGKIWASDTVQTRVSAATETVKQQTAPYVADKLGDAIKAVGQTMKDQQHKVTSSAPATEQLPETLHRGTDGHLHADTTGFGPGPDRLP